MTEDQQRLLAHLKTLSTTDLQRLRDCFEYEYSVEPQNRDRIQEILDFIAQVIQIKLAK